MRLKRTIPAVVLAGTAAFFLGGNRARRVEPLEWGLYQIYWGRPETDYRNRLAKTISQMPTAPNYVMFYRDLPRPYPRAAADVIRSFGATPIISLELWHWGDRGRFNRLQQIVEGKYDKQFRAWATSARADGKRILLRFGFEFNGDWFTWGGDPEAFKKAWRRAWDIFKEVGASNVEWVWAANVTSHPDDPSNEMGQYWPGDAYVDWIGVDGYNWGNDYKEWHRWLSFEQVFDSVLDRFVRDCPDKPVMIAEFGCPEGAAGQKAKWIREAHRYLQKRNQIKAVVWFNLDKRREGELDFRIDTTAESLRAFNETFAEARP